MGLHGGCQVSTPLRRTSSPYQVLHIQRLRTDINVADRTNTTLPFTTYQNRPKLCCIVAYREHHETRRDVVSGQTEGNSARVAEGVLRVEFSYKIVQVHQWVKHHKQRFMLASPLGCGR